MAACEDISRLRTPVRSVTQSYTSEVTRDINTLQAHKLECPQAIMPAQHMPAQHMLPGASFGSLTIAPPVPAPVPAALKTARAYDARPGGQSSDREPPGDQHMPSPSPTAVPNSTARDNIQRVVHAARNIASLTSLYVDAGLPGTVVANRRDEVAGTMVVNTRHEVESAFIEGFSAVSSVEQNDALARLAWKPNDTWKGKKRPFVG